MTKIKVSSRRTRLLAPIVTILKNRAPALDTPAAPVFLPKRSGGRNPKALDQRVRSATRVTRDLVFTNACSNRDHPRPEIEYRFHPTRKWRFDYAWPELKIYVEVDGGVYVGGKHGRGAGIEKDHEKRNAAAALGWIGLVTVPKKLTSAAFLDCLVLTYDRRASR